MNQYTRRLPHWDAPNARQFVTFRLYGTLPANRVFHSKDVSAGHAFVAMDRLLDHAQHGPAFLRMPEIANMLVAAIRDGESRFHRYDLHSFVVMPNHVHLLVTSKTPLSVWLRSLKGFTGHRALAMLSNRGPFWQDESYDRLVRSDEEFSRILRYIEWNPVKAGIVSLPEQFPWSSAGQKACGRAEEAVNELKIVERVSSGKKTARSGAF